MTTIGVTRAREISIERGIPLSDASIKHAAAAGKFPATLVGKTWTFERADFEAWLVIPRKIGRPRQESKK